MQFKDLAAEVQSRQPESDDRDIGRACLLLANTVEKIDELADADRLSSALQEVGLRMQLATDQHAAMTEELEQLAASDPQKFSSEQIWVLVRAIKVQGQVLQMYLGGQPLDV